MFKGGVGGYGLRGGTLKALGVGAGALSMALDSSGQTRALLNLFYEDNRVVIRSNPKLFVKSGGTATLEVGNEIPVITQISDEARQSRRLHQHLAGRHLPQDRRFPRNQPDRAGQRAGGPRDLAGTFRSADRRFHQHRGIPDYPQPPHQHQPDAEGRRLPRHGRPDRQQPQRRADRRYPFWGRFRCSAGCSAATPCRRTAPSF